VKEVTSAGAARYSERVAWQQAIRGGTAENPFVPEWMKGFFINRCHCLHCAQAHVRAQRSNPPFTRRLLRCCAPRLGPAASRGERPRSDSQREEAEMKANIRFNYVFWKEGPLSLVLALEGLLPYLLPFYK